VLYQIDLQSFFSATTFLSLNLAKGKHPVCVIFNQLFDSVYYTACVCQCCKQKQDKNGLSAAAQVYAGIKISCRDSTPKEAPRSRNRRLSF